MLKLAIVLVLGGIVVATSQLPIAYSYWFDELFSVSLSSNDLHTIYRQLLLDVHPPLYPLALKYWMLVFGTTEPATRSFSWVCAMLALVVFWRFAKKQGQMFFVCAVVIFSTNMLFAFYANETRAYALTLLLATLLVTRFPFERCAKASLAFLFSCLFLSLTHYFGLVLAGIALLMCLVQSRKKLASAIKIVVTGLLCLLWPIHHMMAGTLLSVTGKNSWIKPHSVSETLDLVFVGFVPGAARLGAGWLGLSIFMSGSVFLLFLIFKTIRLTPENRAQEWSLVFIQSATLLFLVVSTIAVIDQRASIATSRNFIILLPLVALVVGGLATRYVQTWSKSKNAVFVAVCMFAFVSLIGAYRALGVKASAPQDWKTSVAVAAEQAEGRNFYVTHSAINFYLNTLAAQSARPLVAEDYTVGSTELRRPALLVYGQLSPSDRRALVKAMNQLNARRIYPEHNQSDEIGVYLID